MNIKRRKNEYKRRKKVKLDEYFLKFDENIYKLHFEKYNHYEYKKFKTKEEYIELLNEYIEKSNYLKEEIEQELLMIFKDERDNKLINELLKLDIEKLNNKNEYGDLQEMRIIRSKKFKETLKTKILNESKFNKFL